MKRRSFLVGVAATLAGAPQLEAQPRTRRIAVMDPRRPADEMLATGHPHFAAFHAELRKRGFVDGNNLSITIWSGAGRTDRDEFARQVVASEPEVIFAPGSVVIGPPLMRHTDTIPIVFLGQDPLRQGLVDNLARPGANVTMITTDPGREIAQKNLQLLAEAAPSARRMAYVNTPSIAAVDVPLLNEAAAMLSVSIVSVTLNEPANADAYRAAFRQVDEATADAVFVGQGVHAAVHAPVIADLAYARRLPCISNYPEFASAGGLMTYGVDYPALFAQAAGYVARILNGEEPSELPVQQPTVFEFVINLKTAQAFGITISPKLLIQATELIE